MCRASGLLDRFWPGRRADLFDQWFRAGRSIPLA
jgi:hypothetical protein